MERLTLEERAVLRLIPVSDTKRINRVEIMNKTKLSQRRVKKIIDNLVNKCGIVIIGERNGHTGYFIPETNEAREKGIRALRAQAYKELKRVRNIMKSDLKSYEKYLEVKYEQSV